MGHMQIMIKSTRILILGLFLLGILLSACEGDPTPTETIQQPTVSPSDTSTPELPTPTTMPLAAVVNGEGVSLAWYESEVSRYLLAQENSETAIEDEATARENVLEDVIDQVLLAQGASASGFSVSDADVQSRLDQLATETDLPAWMTQWGYTQEELFQSLKLQILAGHQKEQIIASIPDTVEQVELQQVFAYTETGAKNALISLKSGRDFDEVALTYDPTTGGYLGWTPRGYLLIPALEEIAFNLPVGEYSDVIESEIGYHILTVLGRAERPLTSDARLILQRGALYAWLNQQREQANIEVLVD
jgi:parvulin-like peptidyl-prolyl isomerase